MTRLFLIKTEKLLLTGVLAAAILCQTVVSFRAEETVTETAAETMLPGYSEYLRQVPSTAGTGETVIQGKDFVSFEGVEPAIVEDAEKGKVISLYEGGAAGWTFTIPSEGLYQMDVLYRPIQYNSDAIVCDILLDDRIPFAESRDVTFERNWINGDEHRFDIHGNQIRPAQVEQFSWMQKAVTDPSGMTAGALRYHLAAGVHSLKISVKNEAMMISAVTFRPATDRPAYAEVAASYDDKGYAAAQAGTIRIEAESGAVRSDQSMYPLTDRSSPMVRPYSPSVILYNTIGGTQWKTVGQWIEWEIPVEKDGLYQIALHFKQSIKSDAVSVRELYIDGELPFAEASHLYFAYDPGWQTSSLVDKDGKAYRFYLAAGTRKVRLQVGLGEYAAILKQTDEAIGNLNRIYREVVVITGVAPDQNRDYEFAKIIPEVLEEMIRISKDLKKLQSDIQALGFSGNQGTDAIRRLYLQLDRMTGDPEIISRLLTTYRDNISSFGTWRNQLTEQPLEADCLYLQSPGSDLPQGDATALQAMAHYIRQFFYSFISDYSSIGDMGGTSSATIKAWMTTGRDQAQLVKQLINDRFTPDTGIQVNLQLVSPDSLLPALLADTGPDVSLGLGQSDPLNLALRHALVDLSQLDKYSEVAGRFSSEAILPFMLDDAVYALPDAQSYMMLFYRKDVLDELGIDPADLDSWKRLLHEAMPVIQKNALSVGLACNIQTFLTLFYQMGGSLYMNNDTASGFGTSEGIQAMTQFIMLYSQYRLPLAFDYANRFRSGEMPVVMADYLFYNQLTVFAPEIKGLWGMLPVPGTLREDGTMNHATVSTVSGNVILSSADDVEASWEFLKWWTSADIQSEYGRALESVIGSAARYNTANIEAMKTVRWDSDVKKQLSLQLAEVKCLPEVPGGYLTARYFDFAVRRILFYGDDIRTSLTEAVEDIDMEIAKKRSEYGLK
ncbi:MAG: extracellular solute-binding protein [Saccharofermentanales bacterium]